MPLDHITVSLSQLTLAKASGAAQDHVDPKTRQSPMRRLLSRQFTKRRSAPVAPSSAKQMLDAAAPSPESSGQQAMPHPIAQDNRVHRSRHHRTASTPSNKQPLRSCLKRISKSADIDDICPSAEAAASPHMQSRTPGKSGRNPSRGRDHAHSHAHPPDAAHHRSRSLGDIPAASSSTLHRAPKTQAAPPSPPPTREGPPPDAQHPHKLPTSPVTHQCHHHACGTRTALPTEKHVRIADDVIRSHSSSSLRRTPPKEKHSYNLNSSTDARRRAEILRNQRPLPAASSMHAAQPPPPPPPPLYMAPSPPQAMVPLVVPATSASPPSSYGIPIVFHSPSPVPVHMLPHRVGSPRRMYHQ